MADQICDDELIDLIVGNELLYNPKHPEYKNNMKKHEEWNRIAHELGHPAPTCQNRWKLIRRSYYRDLSKNKPSSSAVGRRRKFTRDLSFLRQYAQNENDTTTHYDESSRNCKAEVEVDASCDAFSEFAYVAADSSFGESSHSLVTEINKSMADMSKLINKEEKKDSTYYFCMSLLEPLRDMEPKKRQLTQAEIMKVIAQNTD